MVNAKLLKSEIAYQVKSNNIIKYLLLFFGFCSVSLVLISSHEDISEFGVLFAIIAIPLALINLSKLIFKADIEDGTLESLLTIFSSSEIIIAKLLALFLCLSLAFVANLVIIYIIFDISIELAKAMIFSGLILCASSSALICLISAIEGYFRSNTNFLSVLIMPLIIPSIVLTGLAISNDSSGAAVASFSGNAYIGILFGISLITVPATVLFSRYLIENIYNI